MLEFTKGIAILKKSRFKNKFYRMFFTLLNPFSFLPFTPLIPTKRKGNPQFSKKITISDNAPQELQPVLFHNYCNQPDPARNPAYRMSENKYPYKA